MKPTSKRMLTAVLGSKKPLSPPSEESPSNDQIIDQIEPEKVGSHTPLVATHNQLWTATSGQPQIHKEVEKPSEWLPTSEKVDSHFLNSRPVIAIVDQQSEEKDQNENLKSGQPQLQVSGKVATHKSDRHTKKQLTLRYDDTLLIEIKSFCQMQNLPLQEFHERAVMHYMESLKVATHLIPTSNKVATHLPKKVDSHKLGDLKKWLSHDDIRLMIEHDDIIMSLYEILAGTEWVAQDKRAAKEIEKIDFRVIIIGMIYTYMNKYTDKRNGNVKPFKRQINSFAYFVPQIVAAQDEIKEAFSLQTLEGYYVTRKKIIDNFLKKQNREPFFEKLNSDDHKGL